MKPGRAHEPTGVPTTGTAPPIDDDLRVVELARHDPREFAPLYERYADPVYYFCYRRLDDPHDASQNDDVRVEFVRRPSGEPAPVRSPIRFLASSE